MKRDDGDKEHQKEHPRDKLERATAIEIREDAEGDEDIWKHESKRRARSFEGPALKRKDEKLTDEQEYRTDSKQHRNVSHRGYRNMAYIKHDIIIFGCRV